MSHPPLDVTDTPDSATDSHCQNCGRPLDGLFCSHCGQEARDVRRPFLWLLRDALRVLFDLDSRAYKTVYYLFTRPAFLSDEYVKGRRHSYTPPLRLFLVISIGFFIIVGLSNQITSFRESISTPASQVVEPADPAQAPDEIESGISENGIEQIYVFIDNFNLGWLSAEANANLHAMMREQAETNFAALQDDPEEFLLGALDYITFYMLLLMPLLALIQRIVYIGTGRIYIEHLVLTLHNQTFFMLSIFLVFVLNGLETISPAFLATVFSAAGDVMTLWIIIYLFLSVKRFFGHGYFVTALKFFVTSILYGIVFSAAAFLMAAFLFFFF